MQSRADARQAIAKKGTLNQWRIPGSVPDPESADALSSKRCEFAHNRSERSPLRPQDEQMPLISQIRNREAAHAVSRTRRPALHADKVFPSGHQLRVLTESEPRLRPVGEGTSSLSPQEIFSRLWTRRRTSSIRFEGCSTALLSPCDCDARLSEAATTTPYVRNRSRRRKVFFHRIWISKYSLSPRQ